MYVGFGSIEIDRHARRLLRDGIAQKVEPRALDMLLYLVAHPGRVIGREELMAEVWRTRSLSEGVLATAVAKLRKALGQATEAQSPIETVRGRGYRWTLPALTSSERSTSDEALVERAASLDVLDTALQRAVSGEGGFVLLSGEAGSGKTRLLRELARLARAKDMAVFTGVAGAGTQALPYFPWAEVLRSAHRQLGAAGLRRHLPARSSALAALVPELDLAPAPVAAAAVVDRASVYAELRHLLASASAERPSVVALDDLQRADSINVDVLEQLVRSLAQQPLLFVAAVRDNEQLPETRRGALRAIARSARLLAVDNLSCEACGELAAALQGAPAAASARAALYRYTRGNPLFVHQVVALVRQRGGQIEASTLQGIELPSALRDIVRERVAALPKPTAAALADASVLGTEIELGMLARLRGCSAAQALLLIEPALEHGLLQRDERSVQRFAFVHGLVRDALYSDVSAHARGWTHARILELLSERALADDARLAAEVAHHALSAVPLALERCVQVCRSAARAAREATAFEAAAAILARLVERVASEPAPPELLATLWLELGVDQYGAGDIACASETLMRAAQLARSLADLPLLAAITFRLLDCLEVGSGDEAAVRALLEHALSLAKVEYPSLYAALLAHRAELATELGFAQRAALLDQAQRLTEADASDPAAIEVACCRVNLRDPSQPEHGQKAARELRALLEQHAGPPGDLRRAMRRFSAEVTDYVCSLSLGDLAASELHARALGSIARECPLMPVRLLGHSVEFGRALSEARLEDASALVDTMRELCARVTGELGQQWLYHTVVLIDARDEWHKLHGLLTPTAAANAPRWRYAERVKILVAWCEAHMGHPAEARALLQTLPHAELERMPVLHGDLGTLSMLAETCALLGERKLARSVRALLSPYRERIAVGPMLEARGVVSHYLGLLADTLGRPREAIACFTHARDRHQALHMPLYHARSQAQLARARSSRSRAPAP